MHPFGGTPICPRCNRAVYAAEQIMGPGRKLYHKPCLSCTSCKKRLDSYNLVEHNEDPYCKGCHVKNFGTRDLRHANLPDRDDVLLSPPTSPMRATNSLPTSPRSTAPPLPARKTPPRNLYNGARTASPAPIFKPTHSWSPKRTSFSGSPKTSSPPSEPAETDGKESAGREEKDEEEDWGAPTITVTPSRAGTGFNGFPRTVPPESAMTGPPRTPSPEKKSSSAVTNAPSSSTSNTSTPMLSGRVALPLGSTPTGTRYGTALSGRMASPMAPMPTGRQFGGSNPSCGNCGKTVYFAEQIKAIGKTYHRGCLRCTECNTLLDSSRLTEKDGDAYCKHCYGKLYGPAGNGYALLGKAGG